MRGGRPSATVRVNRKEYAVSTGPDPVSAPDDEPAEISPEGTDAFAGLTGIDVVDGELIPSERTSAPTQDP